jgi:hypothetical protein
MVLMCTYFFNFDHEGTFVKIYILNFFKKCAFWRDLELWESILIECIYLEKKATIKMILSTSVGKSVPIWDSKKSDLIEA